MQQSITALALILMSGLVQATSQCAVTIPMQGTIWKTGSIVTIAWSGISTDTLPYITLAQLVGDGRYSDVAKLASAVPTSPGRFSIKLPANIVSSSDYILLIGDSENTLCQSGPLIVMNDGTAPAVDQISSHVDPVGTTQTANTLVPITTSLAPHFVSGLGDHAALAPAATSSSTQSLPNNRGTGTTPSKSRPMDGSMETKMATSMASYTGTNLAFTALIVIGAMTTAFQIFLF